MPQIYGRVGVISPTFPKQRNVSVTRDRFETYYSVKPVFSETRLRRDQIGEITLPLALQTAGYTFPEKNEYRGRDFR